jgi:hypothetical protein
LSHPEKVVAVTWKWPGETGRVATICAIVGLSGKRRSKLIEVLRYFREELLKVVVVDVVWSRSSGGILPS